MDHLTEPRGRPIKGARNLSLYINGSEDEWRSVYGLDREEFGLIELNGQLCGFSNWIDNALRRRVGKRRQRRNSAKISTTEATTQA
jgi:hypothetical protein